MAAVNMKVESFNHARKHICKIEIETNKEIYINLNIPITETPKCFIALSKLYCNVPFVEIKL